MVFLEDEVLEVEVAELASLDPRMEFELAIFLEVMTFGTGAPLVVRCKIECAEMVGRSAQTWARPGIASAN